MYLDERQGDGRGTTDVEATSLRLFWMGDPTENVEERTEWDMISFKFGEHFSLGGHTLLHGSRDL